MSSLMLPARAGDDIADRGWLNYNNDLLGQRFSPLKQINKTNVASLKQVCAIKIQEGVHSIRRRLSSPARCM
jgi:glucose dehydrogenase